MSLSNPDSVVTEQRLSEFYNEIYPYLGGSAAAGFTPVGTVISVMSNHAPANYLICDGTVYNIADYPELANHFLNEFGSKNKFGGNGTTTFAVPNLLGEFLRMTGTNSHANQGSGAGVGVHQDATELPFVYTYKNADGTIGQISGRSSSDASNEYNLPSKVDATIKGSGASNFTNYQGELRTSSSDETYKVSTRPTNTSVLFCIATKNIYLNPSNDYSTDEKVVGTWIDGKTLYQKSFSVEDIGESATCTISTGLGSIADKIISICMIKSCTGTTGTYAFNIPYTEGSNSITVSKLNADGTIVFTKAATALTIWKGTYIVTIQYTKTSD